MPKILLVEDNELNREMLSRRLIRKGFEVVMAFDGLQGVAMASAERPDLVLMDMSLPGIDGWEATRRLRASGATQALPVIALTAHAMSDDRAKAMEAGCDDFDTKPVDLERLLGKINGLLQARAPQRQPQSEHLVEPQSEPQSEPRTEALTEPLTEPSTLWATDLNLPARPASLPALQAALDELCTRAAMDRDGRADLQVVLDEVCANIFKHAYPPDAPGSVRVALRYLGSQADGARVGPAAVELTFIDQGRPFDPLAQPKPDLSLAAQDRPLGGLGIHMVRQLTDSQRHRYSAAQGNCLTLVKHVGAVTNP